MEIKSTLKVINSADIKAQPGVTDGQTMARMVGCPEIPTDRIRAGLATYKAGTVEALHWHPIESFDFVIAGHGIVRDLDGNEYEVGPGCFIYAPPGIAGAHEWVVKEGLQLVAFRATHETNKKFQFTVDKETKRSYIDLEELAKRDGVNFKSQY